MIQTVILMPKDSNLQIQRAIQTGFQIQIPMEILMVIQMPKDSSLQILMAIQTVTLMSKDLSLQTQMDFRSQIQMDFH